MTKPVVLLAEELSPATIDALGPEFDIRHVDGTDRPALLAALADASAVLVRSATQIDAEALAAAPVLKVVARAGVGLDNVDIKAATTAGVMVVNAPTSRTSPPRAPSSCTSSCCRSKNCCARATSSRSTCRRRPRPRA